MSSLLAKLFAKKKLTRALRPRQARPAVEALEPRLVAYAASSSVWPNPQLVTISFEPDGTSLGGSNVSNLFATMNARFGSASAWEGVILKAAQAWAQQTNLNFAVVGDSGAAIGSGPYEQGDATMGDIRIGGYNFGNNTLGQAYTPPPINDTSYAGDIQFNTGQSWSNGIKSGCYDLYTVALHEIGHALGLYHSSIVTASMYANYTTAKNLTSDDVAGIRSIYSAGAPRAADVNGGTNTSFGAAVDVSSAVDAAALTGVVSNLNVATAGTSYYYMVTVPAGTTGTLSVAVQSSGLSLLTPQVTLYAAAGQSTQSLGLISGTLNLAGNVVGGLLGGGSSSSQPTQIGSASGSGYTGGTATVTVSNVTAGQVYYIQVQGANTTAFGTGNYALSLDFGANPLPVAVAPTVPVLNGPVPVAGGGQPLSINPAFQVPAGTGTQQTNPMTPGAVGMDANGNYVTVWAAQGQDGSGWGVYGQRYNAIGAPQGGVFQVNTTAAGDQTYPTVAMAANGSFVVTWSSYGQDGGGWGVYAQRYTPAGVALGGEFRVNTTTAGDQTYSSVAMAANASFVITWSSNGQDGSGWGVFAQRYGADGKAQGGEFRVNTTAAGDQTYSSVAMAANASFVITWSSNGQDGSGWGVYAQRYSAAGLALGGEFRVNSTTRDDQKDSAVAMNPNTGDFVITWSSDNQDGSGEGVYARLYNAQGVAQGGEFLVNTYTKGDQTSPCVAMDGSGNFLITWQSYGEGAGGSSLSNWWNHSQAGDWDVYAQQYNANGTAIGAEFRVNTDTAGDQQYVSVAMDGVGDAVALWTTTGGKGAAPGVFGQRYLLNGSPGLMANAATDGLVTGGSSQTNTAGPGSVATDASGNYVTVWSNLNETGSGWLVYGQLYAADGTPGGAVFQVSTYYGGDQLYPSVAMSPGGAFVITWSSNGQDGSGWGVFAQLYNADGTPDGGTISVNTYTAGDQMYSSAAMDDAGNFVITWSSNGQDGSSWGIFAQRYGADGTANGGEFQVNTTTAADQMYSTVATDGAGNFVITWASHGQDGGGWGVFAQRYSAAGLALGGEFQVNTTTAGDQSNASVAMNRGTGDFVIAWSGTAQDGGGWVVFAQRYNADGVARGAQLQVSTTPLGSQTNPSVAVASNGSFLISWAGTNPDGSGAGIVAQQFDATGTAVGGETAVSTTAGGDQHNVTIVMDAQGNATAVWSATLADGTVGVLSQRLLADGAGAFALQAATDVVVATGSQPSPHGGGCDCPLCQRLMRALGAPTAG